MASGLLIDSDILIDYLRENTVAINFLENVQGQLFISAITVGELYSGVRDGKERIVLDTFVNTFGIIPINAQIAAAGGLICREFRKSHGVGLADALIAATASANDLELVTLNRKHYPMLKNLVIPYKKA